MEPLYVNTSVAAFHAARRKNTIRGYMLAVRGFLLRYLLFAISVSLFVFSFCMLWIAAGIMLESNMSKLCVYHPCTI